MAISVALAKLQDYPHVPVMRAGRLHPDEIIRQLNAGASSPDFDGIDESYCEVCDAYDGGPESLRELFRSALTEMQRTNLFHFAHRMAIRLLRTRDLEFLRSGLLALSLEDFRQDFRDSLTGLATLRYAADETSNDWKTEYDRVVRISSPEFIRFCQNYASLTQSPGPVSLESYLMRHTQDVNGETLTFGS